MCPELRKREQPIGMNHPKSHPHGDDLSLFPLEFGGRAQTHPRYGGGEGRAGQCVYIFVKTFFQLGVVYIVSGSRDPCTNICLHCMRREPKGMTTHRLRHKSFRSLLTTFVLHSRYTFQIGVRFAGEV